MAEKMLVDASHPEETRVVVVRGNRIEEFDFESQHKKQLRGNIYLAKVTRVEPSLQAAFVDYGGNRHGFLAFSEIHPDYYQIPLADRQALLQAEAEDADSDPDFDAADEPDKNTDGGPKNGPERGPERGKTKAGSRSRSKSANMDETGEDTKTSKSRPRRSRRGKKSTEEVNAEDTAPQEDAGNPVKTDSRDAETHAESGLAAAQDSRLELETESAETDAPPAASEEPRSGETSDEGANPDAASDDAVADMEAGNNESGDDKYGDEDKDKGDGKPTEMAADVEAEEISEPVTRRRRRSRKSDDSGHDPQNNGESQNNGGSDGDDVESVGSEDALEEVPTRAPRKPRKQYRIQEVIKRRQILLVQVVKEERGNKGAALTTYLSLAGRYSVLMPNTARGGGISRKITNLPDRKRLKEIARELEVPQGMGVILRTAGANRTKVEIKRDFEYLMRLWENVRNLTLKSTAPSLVYEEGSLIKRSIRDLYNKDISEVVVSGEEGYREAKDFMKMLMPSHAKVVQPYRDLHPIFARSGIEAQLDRMLQPQVTLKSGGYIIINQTEALVAVDVNSGRSTREHSIEDTALQTNLEAADEVARQLRLRDLAGLIVIDFIDMEENRNNRAVEKRMKECLKNDRARIQVGRISHFGLLEMSRQRIRASVLESTMQICPTCSGTGYIRSESSVALHVLRGVEEYLLKQTTHDIIVRTSADTAFYMLNHKRDTIVELENRFGVSISFSADDGVGANHFAIDRGAGVQTPVNIDHITVNSPAYEDDDDDKDVDTSEEADDEPTADPSDASSDARGDEQREDGQGRKRRRRRRRGGRKPEGENGNGEDRAASAQDDSLREEADGGEDASPGEEETSVAADGEADDQRRSKRRRRGKRGGRRNREEDPSTTDNDEVTAQGTTDDAEAPGAEAAATPTDVLDDNPTSRDVEPDAEPEAVQKPARKRRRTKAQIAADEAAKAAQTTDMGAAGTGENNGAETGMAMATDQPDAKAESTDAITEVASETLSVEDEDAARAEEDRLRRTDLDVIASSPVLTSSTKPEESKKPKKGGWWQKRGFF